MRVTFHYDKKAVIGALRFHFLNRMETKVIRVLFIIFFLLAIFGYLKAIVPYAAVVLVFLIIVALTLVLWKILPNTIYKKARTFHEPSIELDFSEEGMSIATQLGGRRLAWESFNRVLETGYFFYLYQSKNAFFLIPADAFNDQERSQFRELLHRHVDSYRVKTA
jgi:hypothetical protein